MAHAHNLDPQPAPAVAAALYPFPGAADAGSSTADRWQSLFAALPAAVIVLDGEGRVAEANPAASRLFGDGLGGQPWRQLVSALFLFDGPDLKLHNGRLLNLSTQPLGDRPGQILLFTDVTEKRQLQQALGHHKRLVDMGRMAASLAHQIRTPLASAILYLSQLAGGELAAEQRQRFSRKALERLRDLERLIGDMLLFARGERGESEPLVPHELLAMAVAPLQEALQGRGIAIEVSGEDDGLQLHANRQLLVSALQNLINNAAEVLGEKGRIRLSVEPLAGSRLGLSVCDDGPGIPVERQAQIFEPFVSHRPGGTGLGLAVVRAVAQAHGGRLQLQSVPGEGSRFTLELPARRDNNPTAASGEGR